MRRTVVALAVAAFALISAAHAEEPSSTFTGRVVFQRVVDGEGERADLFRELVSPTVVVHFGDGAYRQDEPGGVNAGSYLARDDQRVSLRLDHEARTSMRGGVTDLEAADAKVKASLPLQYETALEPTGETSRIQGYPVRRFRVKRSAFVAETATAFVWITEAFTLPRRRFRFEHKAHRAVSPLPLSIPIDAGTILKAEIGEGDVQVTIVATEVSTNLPARSLFDKPAGYAGEGFPRPEREPLSEAEIAKLPAVVAPIDGMRLVLIRPGSFQMGTPPGEPHRREDETQHQVTIARPYYIGVHEVTQAQWRAVLGETSPSKNEGETLPVEGVTWHQAQAFCAALSRRTGKTVRLPTEAEWEYAARAGETVDYRDTAAFKAWVDAHAWHAANAESRTHPVGSRQPNAWGLFDTIGNVSEWVADGYGPYPDGAVQDPAGTESDRKVVRGASWVTTLDRCRVGCRGAFEAGRSQSTIGFRVVMEP